MKLKCRTEDLLYGFQQVQNIANARTTLPILGNVLLDAKEGGVTLTATDLEVGIKIRIPSEIEEEGITTLPARKMFNLIKELSNQDLKIEVESNHLTHIYCGTSFFKIVGCSESDFPKLPSFDQEKGFILDQKDLKNLIQKTSYAISKDETRYVLNGLYLAFLPDKLIAVATDGRRLAYAEVPIQSEETLKEFILPSKAIQEISKILRDEGQVHFVPFENQLAFVFKSSGVDDCVLISRLIEGSFPSYKQVIPSKVKGCVVLNREELLSAVRRVAVVTNEKSNLIKIKFSKNLMSLSANTPDIGEAKEEIPLSYEGEEITIAFNPNYLMDVLKNLEEEEVSFEFNDALSPGIIRCSNKFIYVIMPMRVS